MEDASAGYSGRVTPCGECGFSTCDCRVQMGGSGDGDFGMGIGAGGGGVDAR